LKIAAFALSAAVLGLASAGPASALSLSSLAGATNQHVGVSLADYKPNYKDRHRGKRPPPHRYNPGGHYKHAPHGWRRYDRRPGDWRTRGCVIVGPIWWCP